MSDNFLHFHIGNFEALIILDGVLTEQDKENETDIFQGDFKHPAEVIIMCLLIRTGQHSVLIDTGCGILEPEAGNLLQILKMEGIKPEEIDIVVNSHGHFDHIGGNADAEGNPVFQNAHYLMNRKEWEFWTDDPYLTQYNVPPDMKRKMIKAIQLNLTSLKNQFLLIDSNKEIVPGIELIEAAGHTPGHCVLLISSGEDKLLSTFDLFPQPHNISRPDLYTPFDLDRTQASHSRIDILSQIITTNVLVFSCHFRFPGLGHVIWAKDMRIWSPIKTE